MSAASSRERAPARSWRATARVPIPGVPAIVAGVGALALLAPKPSLALAAFAALSAVAALLAHFGGPARSVPGELRLGETGLRFRREGQSRGGVALQGEVVAVDLVSQRGVWDVTLFDAGGRSSAVRLAELERASLLATLGLDGAPSASQFAARGPFGKQGFAVLGAALVATGVVARLLGSRLDEGDRVAWALVIAAAVWAPVLVARVVQRVVRVGRDGVVVRSLAGRRAIALDEVELEAAGVCVQIFKNDALVETVECSSPRAARDLEKALDTWRGVRKEGARASAARP